MFRTIVLTGFAAVLAATTVALAPPARAQIGNIFSDIAPRPPGSIPRGNAPSDDEEEVPELPQGRLLPTPNRPLPPGQAVAPPGAVQSQPLAPPPGTTVIPQNTQPGVAATPDRTVAGAQPSVTARTGRSPAGGRAVTAVGAAARHHRDSAEYAARRRGDARSDCCRRPTVRYRQDRP